MDNYYEILKISPTSSVEEIKKAINKELRIWSTKTNSAKLEVRQQAERMVKCLDEAETIFTDSSKRAEYDRNLKGSPKQESHVDSSKFKGGEDLVPLAWKLLSEGNVADALYVATKATEQQGDNAEAWALLGQAKYQWGETEDAIYEYKRAIQIKPNEAYYYFDLGTIYESIERWEESLKQYQRASQIEPATSMYRAAVAGIFVRHGMYREGVDIMEQCVKEEPTNKSYKWLLALAYHEGMLNTWWKNPEDGLFYCISKEQADNAKAILDKIKTLDVDDNDMKKSIRETEELVRKMYERKFVGSWILVGIYSLFYVVPGVLWWFISRRTGYMINKDIYDLVEAGKMSDTVAGGEYGLYYSALPPGFKWAASLPRFVVWILMIILSPISFLYNAYNNYRDDTRIFVGLLAAMIIAVIGFSVGPKMLKGKFGGSGGYSQNQQGVTSYINKEITLRSGPGSKTGQVGKLAPNTQVAVIGSSNDSKGEQWSNIRVESGPLQGQVGYVKPKYLNGGGSAQAAVPAPAAPAVQANSAAPGTTQTSDTVPSEVKQEVTSFINDWIRVWEAGDIDGFIKYYESDFYSPYKKMNHSQWYEYKKGVFSRSSAVKVAINDMQFSTNQNDVVVTFKQKYDSSTFKDYGLKTMQLRKNDGKWGIVKEDFVVIK